MKNILLMVFILTILVSCKSEKKGDIGGPMIPAGPTVNVIPTVTLTSKNELPRIEPTIDLFFPVEQNSYVVNYVSFLKSDENNTYTRVSPADSKSCLLDEQCDVLNIVYFVSTFYEEPEDCKADCVTSNICTLVDNTQTLLYSANWQPESTLPKNLPDTCLTGDNGGDTLYDCTENTPGQNHELAQLSIFQELANDTGSGVSGCF